VANVILNGVGTIRSSPIQRAENYESTVRFSDFIKARSLIQIVFAPGQWNPKYFVKITPKLSVGTTIFISGHMFMVGSNGKLLTSMIIYPLLHVGYLYPYIVCLDIQEINFVSSAPPGSNTSTPKILASFPGRLSVAVLPLSMYKQQINHRHPVGCCD